MSHDHGTPHVCPCFRVMCCAVQCDGCRVLVHQTCYGVAAPPNGRLWLCDSCSLGAPRLPPADPNKKPTVCGLVDV